MLFIRILILCFGGWWSVKLSCQNAKPKVLRKIFQLLYRSDQYFSGNSIAWNSHFDSPPCLPHGMSGIFISGGAKIGKDAVIFQQVTIGSNTLVDSKGRGVPRIGNNVYIGAGAKIIGNVSVGDNVRIGANCIVIKDVPDNSIVVSASQNNIIVKDRKLNNKFYRKNPVWEYFENGNWVVEHDPETLKLLNI